VKDEVKALEEEEEEAEFRGRRQKKG